MDNLDEIFEGFDFDNMPEKGEAAKWVEWFGKALAALFSLIKSLFSKLSGGGEETTTTA